MSRSRLRRQRPIFGSALLRWALGLLLALLALSAGVVAWAYRSLPAWSGRADVAGLDRPLEIVRDAHAIPHVFAQTQADAYFGLGYAHAQDRLWQMELDRRLASGRLAEVFGRAALDSDRIFRGLGLRRAAEQALVRLEPATRELLDAYVGGVNAWLASSPPLPPEFGLLRFEPEAWDAVDSLVWLKMMAWMLSSNMDSELARARLSQRLGLGDLAELFPPAAGDPALPLPEPAEGLRRASLPSVTGQLVSPLAPADTALGSNNWVVDGQHTQSGKPLLANDPHLALTTPSIWYLAHLQAPGLDVIGATLPGVPGVILGHNPAVAWAFSNTGSDVEDVFVERLVPAAPDRYEAPGGALPFHVVRELIHVKGEADELLDVRISRHGPVLSGFYPDADEVTRAGYALALAWTGFDAEDHTLEFVTHAALSRTADELRAAARRLDTPPQNVVYADTAGQIGFIAAGRVPLRGPGATSQGRMPVAGWDGRADWLGYIPFEALPSERNPESGRIVTANQKITPESYPYWLTSEWSPPYRAQRIEDLLERTELHTVTSFQAIQLDVQSGSARALLPQLLALSSSSDPLSERERELLERLSRWDLEMRTEVIEPLIFSAWVRELDRCVYADELGPEFEGLWAERIEFLSRVLADREGQGHWCDDVSTPRRESCPEQVRAALRAALADLARRYGDDPASWSWGRAHHARARHVPFSDVPVLRDWFELTTPSAGGMNTVNVGAGRLEDDAPYESRHAAGYRAVYDLADLGASRFLVNGGQSGHVLSPHYRDWVEPWQRGLLLPMLTQRDAVDRGALGTIRLSPLR